MQSPDNQNPYSTGNAIVDAVGEIHLEGNITPHTWYQTVVKKKTGKAYQLAINILSDIVYWYRPSVIRDENTMQVMKQKKKFKEDLLQRSYSQLADFFGVSKGQATDAVIFLEELGVIKRHFRTVMANGIKSNNVLYLELLPDGLKRITFPTLGTTDVGDTYQEKSGEGVPKNPDRSGGEKSGEPIRKNQGSLSGKKPIDKAKNPGTNTENSLKISTKISTKTNTLYREFVKMTPKEYEELLNKYGKYQTEEMLDMLDNYKGSTGKTYKSDYRAILSWVVKRYNEDHKGDILKNGKDEAARRLAEENGLPF